MINLLYHSHTVVPAHLEELAGLGVLEQDEQVLVALDGVLQDGKGQRLSGPTLHDYCLLTSLRVLLWARDYGQHLCYAFPLTELSVVEGVGTDPLHAQLQLTFAAPDAEEQRFTLALLPLRDLNAAVTLLHLAGEAAQELAANGMESVDAGMEITTLLASRIYGSIEGPLPSDTPYRWPGAGTPLVAPVDPLYQQDQSSLPPEQIYAAGRLARSAWDTLRRTLRDAELPFDLNSGSLHELAETVRAINELVHTVTTNPSAREMAMAFLNRRGATGKAANTAQPGPVEQPEYRAPAPPEEPSAPTPIPRDYREIPLRRRGTPAPTAAQTSVQAPTPGTAHAPPEHTEIPLRRRATPGRQSNSIGRPPLAMSGSGDAEKTE